MKADWLIGRAGVAAETYRDGHRRRFAAPVAEQRQADPAKRQGSRGRDQETVALGGHRRGANAVDGEGQGRRGGNGQILTRQPLLHRRTPGAL